jgi:hypothetical protein
MQNQKTKYFIYVRKASKDEGPNLISLDDQERALNLIAIREGRVICEVIEEKLSDKEPGRPLFQ